MDTKFDIKGLVELERELNQLTLKARASVLRGSLNKAVDPILKAARQNVTTEFTERTGTLRGSIKKSATAPRGSNGFTAEAKVGVTGEGFYGRFLEFGTSKMPARPFMRPAVDAHAQEVVDLFASEMRRRIEAARG